MGFMMADSVEDDKNEYVQQTDDMDISVINDSKKLEVEKNHVIGKNVINVNEREDVQQADVAKIFVVDDVFEEEEKEDIIDVNERVHEQETDDAETSVMDDCKNLEVGKNDIMEIKTDDEIEKEEKEDDKETRTVN